MPRDGYWPGTNLIGDSFFTRQDVHQTSGPWHVADAASMSVSNNWRAVSSQSSLKTSFSMMREPLRGAAPSERQQNRSIGELRRNLLKRLAAKA